MTDSNKFIFKLFLIMIISGITAQSLWNYFI